ncbi:MAG: hypothetical protein U0L12_05635 [Ruminococcus sp.]|nr:hypothetical protein [Ruminococcus sp.]
MVERKYLAHFLDAKFDMTYKATEYARLGKDLEEYSEELNPEVEVTRNIIGEQSVKHSGYEVSGDVDPFYFEYDDSLSSKIADLAMTRATGDACKTTMVDVLLKPGTTPEATPTVVWAYREDVVIAVNSIGGDTTGIQTPFTVYKAGNRVKGSWDVASKTFTPSNEAALS